MAAVQTDFEEGVLTVMLDRPEKYNAMNGAMIEELVEEFEAIEERDDLRCLVIRGSNRVF